MYRNLIPTELLNNKGVWFNETEHDGEHTEMYCADRGLDATVKEFYVCNLSFVTRNDLDINIQGYYNIAGVNDSGEYDFNAIADILEKIVYGY